MKFLRSLLVVLALCSAANAEQSYNLFARQPLGMEVNTREVGIADFFYNLFKVEEKPEKEVKANRLLVITEPTWCPPCRRLDPVLKKLKAEGYDVYEYTQKQWNSAKPKPAGVPNELSRQKPPVPSLMFVQVDSKTNKVVKWDTGWSRTATEEDIKRYLTK